MPAAVRDVQIWIDSVGWPMTYPLAWLAGCRIVAYVHYPTISTDMLLRVSTRSTAFNNSAVVSSSAVRTYIKLAYYRLFALLYGLLGAFPAVVMVNSTWTLGHISSLWWRTSRSRPHIVYPPCDVTALAELPLKRKSDPVHLCSVAQFRPEKNHRCVRNSVLVLVPIVFSSS
jgi:alpha-1,2-mannosyltransferase